MGDLPELNLIEAKQNVLALVKYRFEQQRFTTRDVILAIDHMYGEQTIRKCLSTLRKEGKLLQFKGKANLFIFKLVQ